MAKRSTREGDWILAIDFGTSFTTAATRENGATALVPMAGSVGDQFRLPSVVWVDDKGELVVGWEAEHSAALAPGRFERTPKTLLGDPRPLQLGREIAVPEAVAAILEVPFAEARRQERETEPVEVRLTHPASWGDSSKEALREAGRLAGIADPLLLEEPVAAAIHFASSELEPESLIAVYDLGGGTFDTAVLQRTAAGGFETIRVGGKNGLGGELFDDLLEERVFEILKRDNPDDLSAIEAEPRFVAQLRRNIRQAKESLSQARRNQTEVILPGATKRPSVQVTRPGFEELIRPQVEESVAVLEQTIADAGIDVSGLAGIYLAGGSSRIPLVRNAIAQRLNVFPETLDEPKYVIVRGAASFQRRAAPRAESVIVADLLYAAVQGEFAYFVKPVDETNAVLGRMHLETEEIDTDLDLPSLGEAKSLKLAASPSAVVVEVDGAVQVLDLELKSPRSYQFGFVNRLVVGPDSLWIRDVNGRPEYKSQDFFTGPETLMVPVRFTRIGLSTSANEYWALEGGKEILWGDDQAPRGFDLMALDASRNHAVAILTKADLRPFGRSKRFQLIVPLHAGIGTEPPQIRIENPPWVRQVVNDGGTEYLANDAGLMVANAYLGQHEPGAISEWIPTVRHGMFAVTTDSRRTVLYRLDGGALKEVVGHPGRLVPDTSHVYYDVNGPEHVWTVEDEDGFWVSLTPEDLSSATLLHTGGHGDVLNRIERPSQSMPVGSRNGFLYAVEPSEGGLGNLVRIPLA